MYFQLAGPYWWSLITRALIRSANWARLRPPGRCHWYGVAASGHVMDPILTLARRRSCVIAMANDTAWHHPMHLHGHAFRVLSRNGEPTRLRERQDTGPLARPPGRATWWERGCQYG